MLEIAQQIAFPLAAADEGETSRAARFTALVERQARFVFRVAYAMLRNAADAEDAAQEVFLKLYRAGAWERMENERAFLARAAWRVAVERIPRRRAEPLDEEMPSPARSPEDAAVAADCDAALHRLINALPEELRQPLALSTVEEMTSPEIAAAMGIAEGTVRTRLMRARQILRRKLEDRYGR
jgi:RNA polymerase sigma-70 factor (ECF subfamily)